MSRLLQRIFLVLLLLVPAAPLAADDASEPLLSALRDELERSMSKLRLEELERPYFIAYRVDDDRAQNASASLGALLASGEERRRTLTVELRVGDYAFDNTNFFAMPSRASGVMRFFGGTVPLPLDDDYRELRRQVWLATDAAYKQALESLTQKRAALQNRTRADELPDFGKVEPAELADDAPPAAAELAEMESLVLELSALFRDLPAVQTSQVDLQVGNRRSFYVNSEGTAYRRSEPAVSFTAIAAAQAEDGMELDDFVSAYGRSLSDLPSKDELARRVRELGERLGALGQAGLLDRYNGPVLFEGQAAAELFGQAFAPKLVAQRRPVFGDERMARFAGRSEGASFEDRIGARILPRFLSVTDDPTLKELGGEPLCGTYAVDYEGIAAAATAVIERGYLKTLLSGRTPVAGVPQSSGNMRGAGVAPSNLIVSSDRGLSAEELVEELLALVADRGAEFGVLVRRLGNPQLKGPQDPMSRIRRMMTRRPGDEDAVEPVTVAYKVYPDGRREPLRNVELSGLNATSFKEIVAAGAEPAVYSAPYSPPRSASPFSFARFSGGPTVVTLAVPALLFEELTLKKPSGEIPKLPVIPSPLASD